MTTNETQTKTLYGDWAWQSWGLFKAKIRLWLEYEVTETSLNKSITFKGGFVTRYSTFSSGDDNIRYIASCDDGVYSQRLEVAKPFVGTSATTSIQYIDETTWTFPKASEKKTLSFEVAADFGTTKFSGKSSYTKVTLTLNTKGEASASISASAESATSANLKMTIDSVVGDTVAEPTITRNGTARSLTWYYNESPITFPYSLVAYNQEITATDTIDAMHEFSYDMSVTVGSKTFTDTSLITKQKEPLWSVTLTEQVDSTHPKPTVDIDGTANITVYAKRVTGGVQGAYEEVVNEDGWIITDNGASWSITVNLSEDYVVDGTVDSSTASIKLKYNTPDGDEDTDNTAFFKTNRNCAFSTGLANNIFIGGCTATNYSSRVWYSYYNDPLYFPDTNYIEVGSNDTRVMGLCKVGDYLGIIKQSNTTDASVYLSYAVSFDDDTQFATKPCANGLGALGEYCFNVLSGETLFLSPDGIVAIEASEDEQSTVKDRSYFINGRLLKEPNLENAYSYTFDGFYILSINNKCYILDGTQKNSWGNDKTNLVYECYYFENTPIKCMAELNDRLWFSDFSGNLCRFKGNDDADMYSDNGENITAEWSTISDDDGSAHYLKTLQKKGTVVNFAPNTSGKVFCQKDDEPEIFVKEFANPITETPPICPLRKKVKKYKRLRFIVRDTSKNAFGVDEIIKSYVLGNYTK